MQIDGDEIELRPLRRAEYYQLGELGCFEDERVELLDGIIVKMSPMGREHSKLEALLNELLVKAIPGNLIVRPQLPFGLSDVSEPEPDLAIVDRRKFFALDQSSDQRLEIESAYLIIELAASSLKKDLGIKARLYASAGVRDYWVVDLERQVIVVHRDPSGSEYTTVERFARSARVRSLLVPEVSVCLEELTELTH